MTGSKIPPNSLHLVDATTMRAELEKITSVDTSTLVEDNADKEVTIIELYFTASQFTKANDVKVRALVFFKRPATIEIMKAMVVPVHHDRMKQLFMELDKQFSGG